MKSTSANTNCYGRVWILCAVACACLAAPAVLAAQQSTVKTVPAAAAASSAWPRRFATPQQAADALVAAANRFDVVALAEIFGPDGHDIVFSGEFVQDRKHAADFAAEAREKKSVSVHPKSGNRAFLLVGDEDWPFRSPYRWCRGAGNGLLTAKPAGRNSYIAESGSMNWTPLKFAVATWKRSTNMPFNSARSTM